MQLTMTFVSVTSFTSGEVGIGSSLPLLPCIDTAKEDLAVAFLEDTFYATAGDDKAVALVEDGFNETVL